MRKKVLLLSSVLITLTAGYSAKAQLALENFNSGIPATWQQIKNDNGACSAFNAANQVLNDSLTHNAWIDLAIAATSYGASAVSTSWFSTSTTPDRWLISPQFLVNNANAVLKWEQWDYATAEPLTVMLSPTGGTTAASFTVTLGTFTAGVGGGTPATLAAALGAYNGSNVRIAFHYTHNGGQGALVAVDNVQTLVLPATDVAVTASTPTAFGLNVLKNTPVTIGCTVQNMGAQPLSSVTMNYKEGTNTPVSQTFTFSPALQPYAIGAAQTFTTTLATPVSGSFSLKVYSSQAGDANHANDTISSTLNVYDSMANRMQLFEEFTGASCDPCANAVANVDAVCAANTSKMNAIRYHIDIPARDLMYNKTSAFVDIRSSFYNLSGVPDGQLNGAYVYPGASGFTSAVVAAELTKSPIAITGTASYTLTNNTFNVTANISALGSLSAGLKAYAALSIDKLTYSANISLESLPQTNFNDVIENMFPDANGTTLTAFTAGQTQTLNLSWVKNHSWGDLISGVTYDSTCTGKIVIWVQDPTSTTVYNSFSIPLSNLCGTTGINNVFGNNSNFDLYPNPTSANATVSFNLQEASDVSVQVVDMVGHVVNTVPAQFMNAGSQKMTVSTQGLASGIYNVRVTTKDGSATKRLTIVRN